MNPYILTDIFFHFPFECANIFLWVQLPQQITTPLITI